jgi:hypothetical protein
MDNLSENFLVALTTSFCLDDKISLGSNIAKVLDTVLHCFDLNSVRIYLDVIFPPSQTIYILSMRIIKLQFFYKNA